jgi:ribonuclease Y
VRNLFKGEVPYVLYVVITIIMLIIGLILGWIFQGYIYRSKIGSIDEYQKKRREELEKESEAEKREMRLQLKEEYEHKIQELELKYKERQKELLEIENRLIKKEEFVDRRSLNIEKKERDFAKKEEDLLLLQRDVEDKKSKIEAELLRVANLSVEDARSIVIKRVEDELQKEFAKKLGQMEDELKERVADKAKILLSQAMESCAIEYVSENTVSVVPLPSDELKGRIIGREGRNIRTFETLTGVDLLIDDTPEAVTLSCFDPVRREIARRALERLIIDGRIHPARIEEFVNEAEGEFEQVLLKEADDALVMLSLYGFPHELKRLIGEMRFRTSYGQNLLQHSIEVANIAGVLASELGENVILAKRAGLLHDIGKVLSSDLEGPHAIVGGDILRRHGENDEVVHSVQAHHNDIKQETVLDVIIQVADTLSATRPGARRENLETYIKRMEDLERIATSVQGVKKAFVVQAGREIRIMVNPEEINEDIALKISHDVAKKIEEEVIYPGIIKVTVVRETRYIDYAK